jgi:FKBP-type peptidyl-prolyl cis-trans isomerase
MRRAAALAFIPLLAALAVAGCGSSSSSKPAAAADTYKSVTVTGAFGKAPTVTIPKETGSGALYTKTLVQGTGATLTSTEGLIGSYVAYDWSGKTSKLLGSSYSQGLFVGPIFPGLKTALVGQKVGSRVLAVVPPKDGFASAGSVGESEEAQEGIGANDTLVFVIDMTSTFNTASVPGKQTSNGGGALPTVTPPASSAVGPTIKIPAKTNPPKTLQVKTLIKGTGAVLKKGDNVAAQFNGYIWRTGQSFQSSWTTTATNGPYNFYVGEGQVLPGWDTGLIGQTVGSRVLLVLPPAEGYASTGAPQAGIKATDTLAFSVDILAAVPPPAGS